MVFKMKYKNLEEIVEQLHGASKMHKGQAKILEKHINDMESSKKSPVSKKGLWDNIHAKRKRGETMRKKGDPGAPSEQDLLDSQ